ncbi:hypothetical protein [Ralstonia insidiosa]|uniref:Uncharacterized protein n=1 Tax=Ralstonia insidiosa TaxID=190721 RepID=A0A848P6D3_9RALS|nr:hypothetical protein [Ralstonia insidiosa]NMV40186.1 hypothetical protein [Ralstonia insidiosa]
MAFGKHIAKVHAMEWVERQAAAFLSVLARSTSDFTFATFKGQTLHLHPACLRIAGMLPGLQTQLQMNPMLSDDFVLYSVLNARETSATQFF